MSIISRLLKLNVINEKEFFLSLLILVTLFIITDCNDKNANEKGNYRFMKKVEDTSDGYFKVIKLYAEFEIR